MVNLRDCLKSVLCTTRHIHHARYAAEIEVWSDRKAKREEITNYDEVQNYTKPTVPTPKERQKQ